MASKVFEGLDELFDYKNTFLNDIFESEKILKLLDDDYTNVKSPSDVIYTQVFPYEYVPYTVEHGKTFICAEVDIRRVTNKTFLVPQLYVWVFTHESLVRLPGGGLRVDSICSEITKIINRSRNYGLGALNLYSVQRFSPINHYQGRAMIFDAVDFNRLSPSGQKIPANRKRG